MVRAPCTIRDRSRCNTGYGFMVEELYHVAFAPNLPKGVVVLGMYWGGFGFRELAEGERWKEGSWRACDRWAYVGGLRRVGLGRMERSNGDLMAG